MVSEIGAVESLQSRRLLVIFAYHLGHHVWLRFLCLTQSVDGVAAAMIEALIL